VSLKYWLIPFLLAIMAYAQGAAAGREQNQKQSPDLDRAFQAAVAQYNAGKFADAAAGLENLLHQVPDSFEVHELLGMVYSSESQDALVTSISRRQCI
jgi:Tfp pilus assembly protein PilF